ncbi:MAG: metallophosphoesterase [Planctomycetota bacterium]
MSVLLFVFVFAVAVLGHLALWTWLYNRIHASRLPYKRVKHLEKYVIVGLFGSLLAFVAWLSNQQQHGLNHDQDMASCLGRAWLFACGGMLAYVTLAWGIRRSTSSDHDLLLKNDTDIIDLRATLGCRPIADRFTYWQSCIRGNQILEVHLQRKVLAMENLPAELEGLRIAHVSDLHMSRQLQRQFFETAIDHANAWAPDLVALTGDLVEEPDCIDWIPATFGRLNSRFGVYALLGNHEQRLDNVQTLRDAFVESGVTYIGGRSLTCRMWNVDVLLAGNECPWFPPAPHVPQRDGSSHAFSVLLSHSPDPLPWARRHQFNLMLAGHTHGGQIRFPFIGPVVCPSQYGVRFASGVFHAAPVLLHVSRGLSGTHPWRFNCPPEITLLELRGLKP